MLPPRPAGPFRRSLPPAAVLLLGAGLLAFGPAFPKGGAADRDAPPPAGTAAERARDPRQVGGEPDSIVQVANLIYAGIKSSHCFSDHFLVRAQKESAISTSRRFHAVKLGSDDLFNFPLVIMTGEGAFQLPDRERDNLRRFVERGGFLLASAGCSSAD